MGMIHSHGVMSYLGPMLEHRDLALNPVNARQRRVNNIDASDFDMMLVA